MRKLFLYLLSFHFTINAAIAQQASEPAAPLLTKVPAVEMEQKTNADYKTSANYWQQQVAANSANEDAWLNLYKATRYSSYTEHSRSIATDNQTTVPI
jgi:hypothetical protein